MHLGLKITGPFVPQFPNFTEAPDGPQAHALAPKRRSLDTNAEVRSGPHTDRECGQTSLLPFFISLFMYLFIHSFLLSNQQSQYSVFHEVMCWHSLTFRLSNVMSPLQRGDLLYQACQTEGPQRAIWVTFVLSWGPHSTCDPRAACLTCLT
jgi:hypothetical protein